MWEDHLIDKSKTYILTTHALLCSALLNYCRYLLEQFQRVKVTHVFREVNRCADNLTKAGCSFFGNFVVLDTPPNDSLCNLL